MPTHTAEPVQQTKSGFSLRIIPNLCNDISEELKAKVKPLKKGEVKTYRLPVPVEQDKIVDIDGRPFLKNRHTKRYQWPRSVLIPTKDEIQDEDGVTKQIAVVKSFDPRSQEIITVPLFVVEHDEGYIKIIGGSKDTEQFYAFMELTDYNGSKQDRDPSKPIYFYEIDEEKQVRMRGRELDTLTEELLYVKNMRNEELISFGKSLMWDTVNVQPQTLRDKMKEYVHKNPGMFTRMHKNIHITTNKALIKTAMEQNIIMFNEPENKFTFVATGQDIATFTRMDNKETIDQFAEWLGTHKEAENVKSAINNFMKQTALQES